MCIRDSLISLPDALADHAGGHHNHVQICRWLNEAVGDVVAGGEVQGGAGMQIGGDIPLIDFRSYLIRQQQEQDIGLFGRLGDRRCV